MNSTYTPFGALESMRFRYNLMYLAFFAVGLRIGLVPELPRGLVWCSLGLAAFSLCVGVLFNLRVTSRIKQVRAQHPVPLSTNSVPDDSILALRATPDLVAAALAAKNARFLEMEAAGEMPDAQVLTAVAIQAALDLASSTQIPGIVANAKRYSAVRSWYLREGKRSEIHPAGHVQRTTPEIFDAGVDALATAPSKAISPL